MSGSAAGFLKQYHHKHVSNALCFDVTTISKAEHDRNFLAPCNVVGPLPYKQSIIDQTIIMLHVTVLKTRANSIFESLFKCYFTLL